MTRAELRRQKKLEAKKGKVYHLTQDQIDKMKEDVLQEAVDISFGLMLSIPANVLARCYWAKSAPKRLPQFLEECLSVYDSIGAGVITVPELIADVEEAGKLKMECIKKLKKLRQVE